ncbi:MAG TPA: hypothetical protein VFF73_41910, partial [Planctomycetota bacterium]|nr:hypothetical protein [Planctomycetota bacterium]
TSWGHDVRASAEEAWIAGPRVGVLTLVAQGRTQLSTALGSALALALLLPSVAAILGSGSRRLLAALALAGALAGLPGTLHIFIEGPRRVDARLAASSRAEVRRAIAASASIEEARELVSRVAPTHDEELLDFALDRVLSFDRDDVRAKELKATLHAAGPSAERRTGVAPVAS